MFIGGFAKCALSRETVAARFRGQPRKAVAKQGERFGTQLVAKVEACLLTPFGLRSLAADERGYVPQYVGGVHERDGCYHQGTVWPWLMGAFVEAWVRMRDNSNAAKEEARKRFLSPLLLHLNKSGLGHVSEIADADAPHTPRGCPFQAWSVGELIRLERSVLVSDAEPLVRKKQRLRRTEETLAQ